MNTNSIVVKVFRIPGAVTEVGLAPGATVADALSVAGMSVEGNESLSLDGATVTTDTVLYDGAKVVVAKAAKSA